ncbi:MAG TPA: NADH-quinone oxidoreductase subunit C [Longimicrobiales bacterium]
MMEKGFEKGLEGLDRGPQASDQPISSATTASADNATVQALRQKFGDAVHKYVVMSGDENVVFVDRAHAFEILRWLREEPSQYFDLCKDISAIDYGGNRPLEIFYELWSIQHRHQLRVKVVLPLDSLEVDSAVPIWQTANWLEREVYDLFGINFRNHPDLRRIMMPENYAEGHPLRKDFPLRGRFSRAEQTRRALSMDVADFYTPTELDVGGEPFPTDEAVGTAPAGATENETDPAFGEVPWTQRAPVPGGDATTGASE